MAYRVRHDPIVAAAAGLLVTLYLLVALAGFIAPYSPNHTWRELSGAPPTPVYTLHPTENRLVWPYVVPWERRWDAETYSFVYLPDINRRYPLRLLTRGDSYKLLGLVETDWHLLGVPEPGALFLLGTDSNGRDLFSRLLYGGQISLTIGFLSLLIAIPIGLLVGGLSGYLGGWVDTLLMRLAEVMMSIPGLFLLVSLAALIPASLSSTARFAMVTVLLALIGWAGFARVIRGMVLSLRSEAYVEAARALGASHARLVVRHILPQTASYVIIAMTVGVPGYLLAESGLSFLGLGIQQPDASWGNMLKEAQELTNLLERPWMMAPGVLIFLAILAFNVVGDAVRDWLDPRRSGV